MSCECGFTVKKWNTKTGRCDYCGSTIPSGDEQVVRLITAGVPGVSFVAMPKEVFDDTREECAKLRTGLTECQRILGHTACRICGAFYERNPEGECSFDDHKAAYLALQVRP